MKRIELIELRRERLKSEIAANLDLLIGSVHKTPSQRGHHLTAKVNGKTVTRYVRKELAPLAAEMTLHHRKVRKLIRELSALNWRWLQLQETPSSSL
jgi:hypothetical protein